MRKNVPTVMIIRCKIYFVFFIFVVYANHENIFTTKISRSTVYTLQVHVFIFIGRQNHTDTVLVVRSVSLIALLIELITIVAVVLS